MRKLAALAALLSTVYRPSRGKHPVSRQPARQPAFLDGPMTVDVYSILLK